MKLHLLLETDEDGASCASVEEIPACRIESRSIPGALGELGWAVLLRLNLAREFCPARYAELMGEKPGSVPAAEEKLFRICPRCGEPEDHKAVEQFGVERKRTWPPPTSRGFTRLPLRERDESDG